MRMSGELFDLLPGEDWQRLETWAAIAGMTPVQYLKACIARGHEAWKDELANQGLMLRPNADAPPPRSSENRNSRLT